MSKLQRLYSMVILVVSLFSISAMAEQLDAEVPDRGPSEEPHGGRHLHIFGSIGYGIPVIDLDYSAGALPITLGMDYFLVDSLGIGINLAVSPVFGVDRGFYDSQVLIDIQPEFIYLADFGLAAWLSIGVKGAITTGKLGGDKVSDEQAFFGMKVGASYCLFLTKKFGLEFGAEMELAFSSEANLIFPAVLVGGRYSIGL